MPVKLSVTMLMMLAILFFGAGCQGIEKEPPPDNLLEESVYLDLLIELQHIRTYVRAKPDSVNADSLNDIVFQKFGVDRRDFMASHRYYQSDIDGQIERVETAIERLEDEEEMVQDHIDSVKAFHRSQQDSMMVADSLMQVDSLK